MKNVVKMSKILLLACLVSIVLLLILSFVMFKADLSEGWVRGCIIAIYLISTIIGGCMAGGCMDGRRFVCGLILGSAYFGVLLLLSVIFQSPGIFSFKTIITTAIICIAGGMLGGILCPSLRRSRR